MISPAHRDRNSTDLIASERHIPRRYTGHDQVRHVSIIDRFKNDDFVAGIRKAQNGGEHSFGGAAGDQDFTLRIELLSIKTFRVSGDGLAH